MNLCFIRGKTLQLVLFIYLQSHEIGEIKMQGMILMNSLIKKSESSYQN